MSRSGASGVLAAGTVGRGRNHARLGPRDARRHHCQRRAAVGSPTTWGPRWRRPVGDQRLHPHAGSLILLGGALGPDRLGRRRVCLEIDGVRRRVRTVRVAPTSGTGRRATMQGSPPLLTPAAWDHLCVVRRRGIGARPSGCGPVSAGRQQPPTLRLGGGSSRSWAGVRVPRSTAARGRRRLGRAPARAETRDRTRGAGLDVPARPSRRRAGSAPPTAYPTDRLGGAHRGGPRGRFRRGRRRSRDALVPGSLFASRVFVAANLVTLAVYAALGGVFFLLLLQLQIVSGYSPLAAGIASLPVTVLMLLLSSRAGRWAQRHGPRIRSRSARCWPRPGCC